jgi:phosphatidylinositol-3-phosphatase
MNEHRAQQSSCAKRGRQWIGFASWITIAFGASAAPGWAPDHTVIVVLENKSVRQIEGNEHAPYLNSLAQSGAYMVQANFAQTPYGIIPRGATSYLPARPSQPNYLFLFSGHDQGVRPPWFQDGNSPYLGTAIYDRSGNLLARPLPHATVGIGNSLVPMAMRPFTTPNLGAAVINAGGTFGMFSESLPYPHYDGEFDLGGSDESPDLYRRKHNPAINWINVAGKRLSMDKARFVLPVSVNLGFTNTHDPVDGRDYRGFAVDAQGKPIGFDQLPLVSIVVPNDQHDAHSDSIAAADTWLKSHIKPYADWARTHNSLLVVTFDEDGATDASHGHADRTGRDTIFTVFDGPSNRVIAGRYTERIDHLNVLATVLDRHGLLGQFKADFLEAHVADAETRAELANLVPVKDIFGEGPPLRTR